MYESSGELSQATRESNQINEEVKRKLNKLSGDEIVDPSILGIAPERAENIHQGFEKRIRVETDVERVLDGIMPSEDLFNPNLSLRSIDTSIGPAEIKMRGRLYQTAINTLLGYIKISPSEAFFNYRNRRITVFPKLDAFSTVVASAKGNFESVLGPKLAHEIVHAHQIDKPAIQLAELPEKLREVSRIRQEEPELSAGEASGLVKTSRDESILTEAQAHILSHSLTGGHGQADEISALKSNLTKARKGEFKIEGINSEEMETAARAIEQMEFNGIPVSRYSENGYASILDLVVNHTKLYLPEKDQDNQNYLNRIQVGTLQIIRLLDQGMSHRHIANLIRVILNLSMEAENGVKTLRNTNSSSAPSSKIPIKSKLTTRVFWKNSINKQKIE